MQQVIFEEHWSDANGRPAGGISCGRGFTISWQNGQLGAHRAGCESEGCRGDEGWSHVVGCTRRPPNGAFVEGVLLAVAGRIAHYQAGEFACAENAEALEHIGRALAALDRRTQDRRERGVEGTHEA